MMNYLRTGKVRIKLLQRLLLRFSMNIVAILNSKTQLFDRKLVIKYMMPGLREMVNGHQKNRSYHLIIFLLKNKKKTLNKLE